MQPSSHRIARVCRALRRADRDALRWDRAVQTVLAASPAEREAMAARAEREHPPEIIALVKALARACEEADWKRRRTQ